ncbi:hypothetical protein ACFL45_11810 [Candidatus Neomarinimicrobiota bacterium]
MARFLSVITLLVLFSNCALTYKKNYEPDQQFVMIFLGAQAGNRILYWNLPRFPHLDIQRKLNTDSSFVRVTILKRNLLPLRYKVGYNGPNFAYDWNDSFSASISARYRIIALDDSLHALVELKNMYAIPDQQQKKWVYAKEDENGVLRPVEE